uniref:SANT domain-containing protein n=1 Tax=Parastrongyloides trichosuri TaxID=131310 RepID=A0A0N4Z574_PARTI
MEDERRKSIDIYQKERCKCAQIRSINERWNELMDIAPKVGVPLETIELAKRVAYNLQVEDEEWTKNQLEEKKKAHGDNFWITNNNEHCYCYYFTNTAFRDLPQVKQTWPTDFDDLRKFIVGEVNLLYKTWYYYIKYQSLESETNIEQQKMNDELRVLKKPKGDGDRRRNRGNYKDKSNNRRNASHNYNEEMDELINRFNKLSLKFENTTKLKVAHKKRLDCLLSKIMNMVSYLSEMVINPQQCNNN